MCKEQASYSLICCCQSCPELILKTIKTIKTFVCLSLCGGEARPTSDWLRSAWVTGSRRVRHLEEDGSPACCHGNRGWSAWFCRPLSSRQVSSSEAEAERPGLILQLTVSGSSLLVKHSEVRGHTADLKTRLI